MKCLSVAALIAAALASPVRGEELVLSCRQTTYLFNQVEKTVTVHGITYPIKYWQDGYIAWVDQWSGLTATLFYTLEINSLTLRSNIYDQIEHAYSPSNYVLGPTMLTQCR